jgi:pyruvate/2-oxoglutarate dehydrogenase complex dihydrolipoamide acyltransferase (E2) component
VSAKRYQGYEVVPFPWLRVPVVDSLRAARGKPMMHALVEVDVTGAREMLSEHRRRTGETLSFTAFIIACAARAVSEHREMQAYRRGRRHLIFFDDVDVCMNIEHDETQTDKQAAPHVVRGANRKTLREIHRDIRAAQTAGIGGVWAMRGRRLYPHLPRLLRAAFWWAFNRFPRLKQRIGGTLLLTSVGMFGRGAAWGITPVSDYTLTIVVGGIGERPALVDGQLDARQVLCLTVSADHNVVDGAPMARFVQRLVDLIESGYGLDEAGGDGAGTAAGALSGTTT